MTARILVLDDEPSIREFLARVLSRAGYEPVLAATGAEALEIVRTAPPAAILCDHRMAGHERRRVPGGGRGRSTRRSAGGSRS